MAIENILNGHRSVGGRQVDDFSGIPPDRFKEGSSNCQMCLTLHTGGSRESFLYAVVRGVATRIHALNTEHSGGGDVFNLAVTAVRGIPSSCEGRCSGIKNLEANDPSFLDGVKARILETFDNVFLTWDCEGRGDGLSVDEEGDL